MIQIQDSQNNKIRSVCGSDIFESIELKGFKSLIK